MPSSLFLLHFFSVSLRRGLSVGPAGLKLAVETRPASAAQVLVLNACAAMPGSILETGSLSEAGAPRLSYPGSLVSSRDPPVFASPALDL